MTIAEFLRFRFSIYPRYLLLMIIDFLTKLENENGGRLEKPPPDIPGQLNGRKAFQMITAIDVWRHIVKFLGDNFRNGGRRKRKIEFE